MDRRKVSMGFLNTEKLDSEQMCNDKASSTYQLEKERFIKDLLQFHSQRGSPLNRIPLLNGKPLDLYTLYLSVTRNGGWEKVTNEERWFDVMAALDLNKSCGNADFALRQIYIKYLHHYEKVHYFGQEVDLREEQNDSEDGPRKKATNLVGGVAFSYNHQQHNISDSTRELLGIARDSNQMFNVNYASLEKSLASGLPNEIDFGINVCLLLSNDPKHALKGSKSVKVVELLISHVGVFKEGPSTYSWDFEIDTNLNFQEFWDETVSNKDVLQLICPENLLNEKVDMEPQPENEDVVLFNHGNQKLGINNREGQRVTQVVHIVRNFLVDDENVEALAHNTVLFRFLMLCIHCNFGCVRQLGLDALSYLSSKVILEPADRRMTQLILGMISRCVHSNDKFEVVRGCDFISQFSQSNEDSLCSDLEESIYPVLIQLLTIHDLQLLLASLEALYQLSENGHIPCNGIVSVHKSIDTLMNLLTIDAHKQLLTSDLSGFVAQPEPILSPPVTFNQSVILPGNVVSMPGAPNIPFTGTNVSVASAPIASNIPVIISTTSVPIVLPVVTTNVVVNGVVAPPATGGGVSKLKEEQNTTKQSEPAPPQTSAIIACFNENEKMAFGWLTSQYEYSAALDICLSKMEMFRRYISECSIHGLQKVVSPNSFENCVKAAFPLSKIVSKDNSTDISFCGIIKKVSQPPKPGASQSFPAIEQVLNQKASTSLADDKLLDGLDRDLVSVAADVGIEIISDLPQKTSADSQITTDVPHSSTNNVTPPLSIQPNLSLTVAQNNSGQQAGQPVSSAPTSLPVGVNAQQLLQQQLQKIMPSLQSQTQTNLPAVATPSVSIISQVVTQAQVKQSVTMQLPLNANIINTVLAQNSRFQPPTSNSGGLSVLQAQLLKQVIESQRLASPQVEQKSLMPPTSPLPGDPKKRKIISPGSIIVKSVKKKRNDAPEMNGPIKYFCEWVGCEGIVFEKFSGIYQHIVRQHFEENSSGVCGTMVCMWAGCDGMPRQKWSFMAHILERHLNENMLRLWSLKHAEPSTLFVKITS